MFNIVKTIYHKQRLENDYEYFQVMYVLSFLIKDKDMLLGIKKVLNYLFNISPTHFLYLLYFNTPQKYKIPYSKKREIKKDSNEFLDNLSIYFNWTKYEKELYEPLINKATTIP